MTMIRTMISVTFSGLLLAGPAHALTGDAGRFAPIEAPRTDEGDQQIQAPRSYQDDQQIQAPRTDQGSIQAPRTSDEIIQAPRDWATAVDVLGGGDER